MDVVAEVYALKETVEVLSKAIILVKIDARNRENKLNADIEDLTALLNKISRQLTSEPVPTPNPGE